MPEYAEAGNLVFRYLDTNGDGTGTKNANGDYSVTPGRFYVQNANDKGMCVSRLIVHIQDAQNFSADNYGNLASALTNGVSVNAKDHVDNVLLDLTDGLPVKSNADWGRLCYDTINVSYGSGNDFVQVRWTFSKAGKFLSLAKDESLNVDLNDDLSGLVGHYFMVQGYYL